jgi:Protein of unknown function (DUF2380)
MGSRAGGFNRFVALPLAILSLLAANSAALAAPRRVAVFPFELLDTSLEGQMSGANAGDHARIERLAPQLRDALAASDRYVVVPIEAVEARARAQNLQACGGCDAKLAAEVGADYGITGQVQKVSNLILNMNIYIREVASGRTIEAASVDMRGDTDESWTRALAFLVRNHLLSAPSP